MNGLNGKVAVCVGATGGIGRAVALLLAQNKVSVAVVGNFSIDAIELCCLRL